MSITSGRCHCPDGQIQTPKRTCITPAISCPDDQVLDCFEGTGCLDDCPKCIPVCRCVDGLLINGKCIKTNLLESIINI
uniref:TIL domain-containing protein n=1 Tax=Acrobeloides nanus TaxID=290746 RepID=A0A914D843_9BILA